MFRANQKVAIICNIIILCLFILNGRLMAYDFSIGQKLGYPVDNEGYPYISKINQEITEALNQITNSRKVFFLDTKAEHQPIGEIKEHHQSIVKTNYYLGQCDYWITHSEMDNNNQGQVMRFRGSLKDFDDQGIIKNYTLLPLKYQDYISEQHPSQIAWLPDVKSKDMNLTGYAGYAFVGMEKNEKIGVWFVNGSSSTRIGEIDTEKPTTIVSIHRKGDYYWLLAARGIQDWYIAYVAHKSELFPDVNRSGCIDLQAFKPLDEQTMTGYDLPDDDKTGEITFGENATLVQDKQDDYYLLATHNKQTDGANIGTGDDYILVWKVNIVNPIETTSTDGASFSIDPYYANDNLPYMKILAKHKPIISMPGYDEWAIEPFLPNCAAGCTFSTDIDGTLFMDAIPFYPILDLLDPVHSWKSIITECSTKKEGPIWLKDGGGANSIPCNYLRQNYNVGVTKIDETYTNIPILQSFSFGFNDSDHHVDQIGLEFYKNKLEMTFNDKNDDDPFSWSTQYLQIPNSDGGRTLKRIEGRYYGNGNGCVEVDLSIPDDEVFVLSGFQLDFFDGGNDNVDHHLKTIFIVDQKNGKAQICYRDGNGDDSFRYELYYTSVPRYSVILESSFQSFYKNGKTTTFQPIPLENESNPIVLNGFLFNFYEGDHHINKLAVDLVENKSFKVFYNDKNSDDDYYALIQFTQLDKDFYTNPSEPV